MHMGREDQVEKLAARGTRAEMQGCPGTEEYVLGLRGARRPKLSPNLAPTGYGPGLLPQVSYFSLEYWSQDGSLLSAMGGMDGLEMGIY